MDLDRLADQVERNGCLTLWAAVSLTLVASLIMAAFEDLVALAIAPAVIAAVLWGFSVAWKKRRKP